MQLNARTRWRAVKTLVTGKVPRVAGNIRMAGAGFSRLTRGWDATQLAIDDVLAFKIGILRARARQLVQDNGEATGLLLDFESDIAGHVGAQLEFRATSPRGLPLDTLNDKVETSFKTWGMRGNCTLDGFDDFGSLQRMVIRTVIVDGEFFAIKHRGKGFADGYALQPIDPDLVDDTYNVAPDATGHAIVMGVKVNRYGRPVSYFIWDRHPASANRGERREIPAADVVHVFKRVRVGQTRGVTWFAPALVTWKLGDQYTESELVQSMLAAAQGGFFVNKTDDGAGFPMRKVTDENGVTREVPIDIEVQPGQHRALPNGWEWQAVTPVHPTANYTGFMKTIKRVLGRAFGRSYASLTGDLSDVNFSSMRIDREREKDQNRLHQVDILVRQFTHVVFGDWLLMVTMTNKLGTLSQTATELLAYATWMCRGWPWIDPLKDAAAAQLEIQMRINSPQRICAERGRDFYKIVDELAAAEAYILEKKLSAPALGLAISLALGADSGDDSKTNTTKQLRLTAA